MLLTRILCFVHGLASMIMDRISAIGFPSPFILASPFVDIIMGEPFEVQDQTSTSYIT